MVNIISRIKTVLINHRKITMERFFDPFYGSCSSLSLFLSLLSNFSNHRPFLKFQLRKYDHIFLKSSFLIYW